MRFKFLSAALLPAAIALAGCSTLPRERGYRETGELVQARIGVQPQWPADDSVAPPPSEPITVERAVALAFVHNPRIREQYARLGLGRAELDEARRIANPGLGYSRLEPRHGSGTQITRSISWSFADLLLLSSRKRFAAAELERLQNSVAAQLLELATETEAAWYEAAGAQQVQAMRDVVAQAAERSAELAQRFFDAGNIDRLQLEQELAAASQARIAAVRAQAEALRARGELAALLGLQSGADWSIAAQLSAPPEAAYSADDLVELALDQRLDLAAARQEVAQREDALGVTRRWRWLGSVEIGYERESETDGEVLRGPSLNFELPIFDQGQAAVAKADAQLLQARAELDALALSVHNDARVGLERVALQRDIAERYRTLLVPRREAIVARTQERVNFMLQGIFELIAARQEEYDAYQEYLEAVRDYWIARAQLRGIVGGRLPDDSVIAEPAIGVEAILPAAEPSPTDHSGHQMDHSKHHTTPPETSDEPAHHDHRDNR